MQTCNALHSSLRAAVRALVTCAPHFRQRLPPRSRARHDGAFPPRPAVRRSSLHALLSSTRWARFRNLRIVSIDSHFLYVVRVQLPRGHCHHFRRSPMSAFERAQFSSSAATSSSLTHSFRQPHFESAAPPTSSPPLQHALDPRAHLQTAARHALLSARLAPSRRAARLSPRRAPVVAPNVTPK